MALRLGHQLEQLCGAQRGLGQGFARAGQRDGGTARRTAGEHRHAAARRHAQDLLAGVVAIDDVAARRGGGAQHPGLVAAVEAQQRALA
jgi:hypothetical protein